MRIESFYKVVIHSIIFSFILAGCQGSSQDEIKSTSEKIASSELWSISPSLASLFYINRVNKETDCLLSEMGLGTAQNDTPADTSLKNISDHVRDTCSVWNKIDKYNKVVVSEALREKAIKSGGFLFYAVLDIPDMDRIPKRFDVGLFESMEECKNDKSIFLKRDFATKPCREWNPQGLLHE